MYTGPFFQRALGPGYEANARPDIASYPGPFPLAIYARIASGKGPGYEARPDTDPRYINAVSMIMKRRHHAS